ncbi:protein of unknown function [Sporobacter termitidis DSM 10068]|uniref:DUF2935 domain-containing protein n=1 Tax=Sporobacter termitidis DSM 10068 TaxID=1123282 RepID=A0A1M5ZGA0_9FIRM|nr:DUF2935 domain-containing protein [Sporobacter termitidis]SHI23295.1 protein of unknown function [Sporobacter termitidis DSM 10068]
MLSSAEYIQLSLESNLFWVRIMKEHAIFIESAMPPPLNHIARQAEHFKQQFAVLLSETIRHANGLVSSGALQSGQYYTNFTEAAEQAVQNSTGIGTDGYLTQMEYNIEPLTTYSITPETEDAVNQLNGYILNMVNAFAAFKADLLDNQSACRIFTLLYTADISHILHEAQRYIQLLTGLQNKDENFNQNYAEFWNQNMAEHAKSMRGLFDPSETAFINEADRYGRVFDALAQVPTISALPDTKDISAFKATATQGMLSCKVKAIMSPLYTDHNLREANHYIHLMQP